MTSREKMRLLLELGSVRVGQPLRRPGLFSSLPSIMWKTVVAGVFLAAFSLDVTRPPGYVYLGRCNVKDGWKDAGFEGLPKCDGKSFSGVTIVATSGCKVRDALPKDGQYGKEVGRIRRGQSVPLLALHPKGDDVFWGSVSVVLAR